MGYGRCSGCIKSAGWSEGARAGFSVECWGTGQGEERAPSTFCGPVVSLLSLTLFSLSLPTFSSPARLAMSSALGASNVGNTQFNDKVRVFLEASFAGRRSKGAR